MWALFLGALALSISIGAILAYHWYKYAFNRTLATISVSVYAVGSGILLLILLGATIITTGI